MYAALKDNQLIYGQDLEKLLELADPGSDYKEFDENEIMPKFYIIGGKILDGRDENDSRAINAYHETLKCHMQFREVDITSGSRPVRDFLLNSFPEKFTEKERKENIYLDKIYEAERKAIELRTQLEGRRREMMEAVGIVFEPPKFGSVNEESSAKPILNNKELG